MSHTATARTAIVAMVTGPHGLTGTQRDGLAAWGDTLATAEREGSRESLKVWMTRHQGALVETAQLTVTDTGMLVRVWAPGARAVKAGATFVRLDDSRRDYAGMHAEHSTADVWTGWDADMRTVTAYRAI